MKELFEIAEARNKINSIMESPKWKRMSKSQQAVLSGMSVALQWAAGDASDLNMLQMLMEGEQIELFKVT